MSERTRVHFQPVYNKCVAERDSPKAAKEPVVMTAGAGQSGFGESQPSGRRSVIAEGPSESDAFDSQDEIAIVRRATEVLGIHHVANWLQSRIPSLDNQIPYTLIKTEDGRSQVERVLLKIEHGVY
jgi:hypothetical protein